MCTGIVGVGTAYCDLRLSRRWCFGVGPTGSAEESREALQIRVGLLKTGSAPEARRWIPPLLERRQRGDRNWAAAVALRTARVMARARLGLVDNERHSAVDATESDRRPVGYVPPVMRCRLRRSRRPTPAWPHRDCSSMQPVHALARREDTTAAAGGGIPSPLVAAIAARHRNRHDTSPGALPAATAARRPGVAETLAVGLRARRGGEIVPALQSYHARGPIARNRGPPPPLAIELAAEYCRFAIARNQPPDHLSRASTVDSCLSAPSGDAALRAALADAIRQCRYARRNPTRAIHALFRTLRRTPSARRRSGKHAVWHWNATPRLAVGALQQALRSPGQRQTPVSVALSDYAPRLARRPRCLNLRAPSKLRLRVTSQPTGGGHRTQIATCCCERTPGCGWPLATRLPLTRTLWRGRCAVAAELSQARLWVLEVAAIGHGRCWRAVETPAAPIRSANCVSARAAMPKRVQAQRSNAQNN